MSRLMLFLLPIIGIAYFLDIFLSETLQKSNAYAAKEYPTWNAILDGKLDSDILIYGSSRAWVHFDATKIGNSLHMPAYNLGIDGHHFRLQYLRHELALEHNPKPKLIIQALDDLTLVQRPDLYNPDQFLPYMLWNSKIKDATMRYEGYNIYDYEIPLVRYYGKLDAFKQVRALELHPEKNIPQRIRGYQGADQKWNSDLNKAKSTLQDFHVKTDPDNILLFEKYLKECHTKNIKVVLVFSPQYIEGRNLIANHEEIIGIYKKFSKKYKIPFYDYSNDTISMQKKYFYNAMHLNKTGSQLFTEKLIRRLQSEPYLKSLLHP